MQNPIFHGKKPNTDEVMGFCTPCVFDPVRIFMISFTQDINLLSFWCVKKSYVE